MTALGFECRRSNKENQVGPLFKGFFRGNAVSFFFSSHRSVDIESAHPVAWKSFKFILVEIKRVGENQIHFSGSPAIVSEWNFALTVVQRLAGF